MKTKIDSKRIFKRSKDVVMRDIGGEYIIVPITNGIGDLEDNVFSLNKIGRAIWNKLDGRKSLAKVISDLSQEFEASQEKITRDVTGFIGELLKRRIVLDAK